MSNTGKSNSEPTKIASVLFDWAGTIVDFGSRAPVEVFIKVFELHGIEVTTSQAREPMGKAKREHIASLFRMTAIADAWKSRFGELPTDRDVDQLYAEFLPLQKEILQYHCAAIPGAKETFDYLRKRAIPIGSSTGYTKELMEGLLVSAKDQGILPDVVICSDDVCAGRPHPWMIFEAMQRLGRYPAWKTVVVDDTLVGIEAGKNAGCWTIGVVCTGNEMGLSLDDYQKMDERRLIKDKERIHARFAEGGADVTVDSVASLPQALEEIERRIGSGQLPIGFDRRGG